MFCHTLKIKHLIKILSGAHYSILLFFHQNFKNLNRCFCNFRSRPDYSNPSPLPQLPLPPPRHHSPHNHHTALTALFLTLSPHSRHHSPPSRPPRRHSHPPYP